MNKSPAPAPAPIDLDWGVVEVPASPADVALGYAAKVGDPIWIDAKSGALIG